MKKNEQGSGTVRPIVSRTTGETLGYQALLPRSLSKAPPGVKNPKAYQSPIGPRVATWAEARAILDAAIVERTDPVNLQHGLPLSHYVQQEIDARFRRALAKYKVESRANVQVSTWRSIAKLWLPRAPFCDWPPARIDIATAQDWFDWLRDEATRSTGAPLSPAFIASAWQLLKAAFKRAKILPNPIASVTKPAQGATGMKFLTLAEQKRFFQSPKVPLKDRVLAGCGMGAALRVGELLALEVADLHLDQDDPHLWVRYGGPHRSPPKGDDSSDEAAICRVELFEPGLGFFRRWMKDHYQGGERVFAGPAGGFLYEWPRRFAAPEGDAPSFSEVVGKAIVSHSMRHSFAVSMLSGSWGYEPQSLEFIQQQMRHANKATTERFYARHEKGTQARQVRHFTGRESRPQKPEPVTAAALLGLSKPDVSFDASFIKSPAKVAYLDKHARSQERAQTPGETGQSDASTHQALTGLAIEVLRAVAEGDPTALAKASDLARSVLRDNSQQGQIPIGRAK